jgi:hypothetical protein
MTGIDKMKSGLGDVIEIYQTVKEALEDKKVTLWEGIEIGTKSIKLFKVVKDFSEIKQELCDLDEAERAELVEYFAEKLDLSNEKVEHIIECAFDWILDGIEFFEAFSYEPEEVV